MAGWFTAHTSLDKKSSTYKENKLDALSDEKMAKIKKLARASQLKTDSQTPSKFSQGAGKSVLVSLKGAKTR